VSPVAGSTTAYTLILVLALRYPPSCPPAHETTDTKLTSRRLPRKDKRRSRLWPARSGERRSLNPPRRYATEAAVAPKAALGGAVRAAGSARRRLARQVPGLRPA